MRAWLRVFFIGGLIAYRGLFNWIRPAYYIPSMLVGPVFQILFFAYLGRYSRAGNDTFFVVGNGVQVAAMAGVFGMALTIGGERQTQTLSPLLATPAARSAVFLGRALPNVLNGLFVSLTGFVAGRLLLDFDPPLSSLPGLAFVVLLTTLSCTAFGIAVGALGLRLRDTFLVANPAYFLMLLFCGVNVRLSALPGWMQAIGRLLPLTHGIQAARKVAAGAALGDVSGLLWTEAGIGVAWVATAFLLLRFFELESRRTAALDRM